MLKSTHKAKIKGVRDEALEAKTLSDALLKLARAAAAEAHKLRAQVATLQEELAKSRAGQAQVAVRTQGSGTGLSSDDINRLIRLCHPDRHNNSQAANDMTAKLLAMRK